MLYDTFDAGKVSRNTAECIYTGIIHDTGVFKYSCTSLHTMEIAGKMMQMGIDYSDIILDVKDILQELEDEAFNVIVVEHPHVIIINIDNEIHYNVT